jgi:CHAD domain-containing protein/CYTH domain-containing protein
MPARVETLRDSTDRSVRLVALGHLADATAAHARLVNETDDEALHDFRVALRRLRSWERAFRPYLKGDLSKKLRRRLRNLARDTGASRDLEVHLDWLANQRRSLGRRQRAGLKWLMSELEQQKADADTVLAKDVDGRFQRLEKRLTRALEAYLERVHLRQDGRAAPLPSFADALAPRVRRAAQELDDHLRLVRSIRDEREGHEARITAKRLRYLLEPVTRVVPGAADLVDRLKALQDVLGDMHDAQIFGGQITKLAAHAVAEAAPNADEPVREVATAPAVELPETVAPTSEPPGEPSVPDAPATVGTPAVAAAAAAPARKPTADASIAASAPNTDITPGIAAIMGRLRERATVAFGIFAAEWLGDASAAFFRDVEVVAERIAAEARDGLEIERKYLLRFVPEEARDGRRIDIAQGYVPGSRLHERIRRVSIHHGSGRNDVHFYRTVKLGEGVTRTEIEEETTEAIFLAMWPLTRRRRLRKWRFEVEADGRTWEIDEFKNRDLVLAEIELDSEDEEITVPDWLAPAIQREVTGEPEFQNINLAR